MIPCLKFAATNALNFVLCILLNILYKAEASLRMSAHPNLLWA